MGSLEDALGNRSRQVQRLRQLTAQRQSRLAERAFVMEGPTVVSAALESSHPVNALYCAPSDVVPEVVWKAQAAGIPVHGLAEGVMEKVSDTVTPQPVLAVAPFLDVSLDSLRHADVIVVCLSVRDPGNLGTIMRSAAAAGVGGVVCAEDTVDPYNPKVVRASAGALFHVPLSIVTRGSELLTRLASWGMKRVAAVAQGGLSYTVADLTSPTALVVGNESWGLSPETARYVDERVTIEMSGGIESLNVAMATTVLCFEAARQRRARPAKSPLSKGSEPYPMGGGRLRK